MEVSEERRGNVRTGLRSCEVILTLEGSLCLHSVFAWCRGCLIMWFQAVGQVLGVSFLLAESERDVGRLKCPEDHSQHLCRQLLHIYFALQRGAKGCQGLLHLGRKKTPPKQRYKQHNETQNHISPHTQPGDCLNPALTRATRPEY